VSRIRAAVLGHFGERDHSANHDVVDPLVERLREAGVEVEVHWYDADHAFFNDTRPEVYDPEAAQRSWELTVQFLHRHLG
jgi:carboxymethylenebutenolidase